MAALGDPHHQAGVAQGERGGHLGDEVAVAGTGHPAHQGRRFGIDGCFELGDPRGVVGVRDDRAKPGVLRIVE